MHQDTAIAPAHFPRSWLPPPLLAAGLVLALGGCAAFQQGGTLRGGYAKGNTVVAILPGKGPLGDAADAIREGLRAAHRADDTQDKPGLKFIDIPPAEIESSPPDTPVGPADADSSQPDAQTDRPDSGSEQPDKVAEGYKEAVSAGATQVIGPLLKTEVDRLATGSALTIPTLALNHTSSPANRVRNLFQLALDPESEAVDLASKAKAMGFTRVLLLVPAGEIGTRRSTPFSRQWLSQGGTLVGEVTLGPDGDIDEAVTSLLEKGMAHCVFLAGDADQALKVYPRLRAKAPTLPVIATSAVYSGAVDPARDQALSGLLFVDTPWILGVGAKDDPLARSRLALGSAYLSNPLGLRLYAMGIDAYRLAPRLITLGSTPGTTFPGETGTLSVDAQGRVQRRLTLAQFTAGGPQPTDVATARPPAVAKVEPKVQPMRETARTPVTPAGTAAVVGTVAPIKEPARSEPKPPTKLPARVLAEPAKTGVWMTPAAPARALARPTPEPARAFQGARARSEFASGPSTIPARPIPEPAQPFQGARARDE